MKHLSIALAACLSLGSVAAQAAPIVGGLASIDGVSVSTTGSAIFSFNFDDYYEGEAVTADFSLYTSSDSHSDFVPGIALSSFYDGYTVNEAEAGADYLAYSSAVAETSGNAAAQTVSYLGFDIEGTGTVSIEVDTSLFAEITDATGSEFADVGVSISDSFGGSDFFSDTFFGVDGDAFLSDAKTLELFFHVDGAESGELIFSTFAVADTGITAQVSEPAMAWLVASSLLALAGLRRKKNA